MPCHGKLNRWKGRVSNTNQSRGQGEVPNSESFVANIEIGSSGCGSGRQRRWIRSWMKSQVHCSRNRTIYTMFHTTWHNAKQCEFRKSNEEWIKL